MLYAKRETFGCNTRTEKADNLKAILYQTLLSQSNKGGRDERGHQYMGYEFDILVETSERNGYLGDIGVRVR